MGDCLPITGHWALFLDIDGTLLDLASTPEAVVVPSSLRGLLDTLTSQLGHALALISGRCLDTIDRLLPHGRDAAGSHGLEWRMSGRTDAPPLAWPARVTAMLEAEARSLPGVLVEHKPYSVALHYARAPEHAAAVCELAEAAGNAVGRPMRLLQGKAVIEVLPEVAGKGNAIKRFMRLPPYAGRIPVFIGDDLTDEDGFAAVNRLGGISVLVGDRPTTAAAKRMASPATVRDWLNAVASDPSAPHIRVITDAD